MMHPEQIQGKPPTSPAAMGPPSRRTLTIKIKIPARILNPYRLLIFIRMVALVLFLTWRIKHQNSDAIWLWGMSVVCELWFSFSWLLDQLPKHSPMNRATDLSILKDKFEIASPTNPIGKSDLPGVDIFVPTADLEKEPPPSPPTQYLPSSPQK